MVGARCAASRGAAPRLSVLLHRLCDGEYTADELRQQLEARAGALGLLATDEYEEDDKDQGQEREEDAVAAESTHAMGGAERRLAVMAEVQQRPELPAADDAGIPAVAELSVGDQDVGCDVDVPPSDGALSWGEPEEASQELSQELSSSSSSSSLSTSPQTRSIRRSASFASIASYSKRQHESRNVAMPTVFV